MKNFKRFEQYRFDRVYKFAGGKKAATARKNESLAWAVVEAERKLRDAIWDYQELVEGLAVYPDFEDRFHYWFDENWREFTSQTQFITARRWLPATCEDLPLYEKTADGWSEVDENSSIWDELDWQECAIVDAMEDACEALYAARNVPAKVLKEIRRIGGVA